LPNVRFRAEDPGTNDGGLTLSSAFIPRQGLVELARTEAAIAIRRRELDLHVGRDLGDEILSLRIP
jgi:hypothetical protein